MSPFLNSPDIYVQRVKVPATVEIAADGAEEFVHRPPPGQGWTFEDGDSAKGTWVRLLTAVVDEVRTERPQIMVRPVAADDPSRGWNVWAASVAGDFRVVHEALKPADAVVKAVDLQQLFNAQLHLPPGWHAQFGVPY